MKGKKMDALKVEDIKSLIIEIDGQQFLLDKDIAKIYGVETKRINEAVKNNPDRFPKNYIIEINTNIKKELVENFDRFKTLKHSSVKPKAFTEKGLYMLATIITSKKAIEVTINIIETFAKIKELSRNINSIMKTTNENTQNELAQKSNKILEEIIDIEPDILEDDVDGKVIETTTKFEFNLGFAKVSRSVKKVKK